MYFWLAQRGVSPFSQSLLRVSLLMTKGDCSVSNIKSRSSPSSLSSLSSLCCLFCFLCLTVKTEMRTQRRIMNIIPTITPRAKEIFSARIISPLRTATLLSISNLNTKVLVKCVRPFSSCLTVQLSVLFWSDNSGRYRATWLEEDMWLEFSFF